MTVENLGRMTICTVRELRRNQKLLTGSYYHAYEHLVFSEIFVVFIFINNFIAVMKLVTALYGVGNTLDKIVRAHNFQYISFMRI